MVKPVLGLAILAAALAGGLIVGALGAFIEDTIIDIGDDDD